jgi:hypothetical protein
VTAGRAGQQVDDLCRACKAVRHHTVMATDADGEIVRVMCDFCRSEHNYRGGGGEDEPRAPIEQHETRIPLNVKLVSSKKSVLMGRSLRGGSW